MKITPYYRNRAPSKEIQDHFIENGGIEAYLGWKKGMKTLAERTAELFSLVMERNLTMTAVIADVIGKLPAESRDKTLEGFKAAFTYLAPLQELTDGRNKEAFQFFAVVSQANFDTELTFSDVVLKATNDKEALVAEHGDRLNAIFAEFNQHSSQEIAECFIGEFIVQHRTHQQSIIDSLQKVFGQLHGIAADDSDGVLGWALKAGRVSMAFPYI